MRHAIKIEDVDVNKETADAIIETLKDFAESLGYSSDRIDDLECRSRDGFMAYSHNKGGIACVAFRDQYSCCENTGFKNADATLSKYWKYDFENIQQEKNWAKDYSDWNDEQQEYLDQARSEYSEASVLFGMDCMYQGVERGIHSLNLRLTVSVKDAPYHRQYDDLIDIDVTFRTVASLKNKLNKLLKTKDLNKFSNNLREAY